MSTYLVERDHLHARIIKESDPYIGMSDTLCFLLKHGGAEGKQLVGRALGIAVDDSTTKQQVEARYTECAQAYRHFIEHGGDFNDGVSENYMCYDSAIHGSLVKEYAAYYAARPVSAKLAGEIFNKNIYQLTGETFSFSVYLDHIETPHSKIEFQKLGYKNLPNYEALRGMAQVLGSIVLSAMTAHFSGMKVEMREWADEAAEGNQHAKYAYTLHRLQQTKKLHDL